MEFYLKKKSRQRSASQTEVRQPRREKEKGQATRKILNTSEHGPIQQNKEEEDRGQPAKRRSGSQHAGRA